MKISNTTDRVIRRLGTDRINCVMYARARTGSTPRDYDVLSKQLRIMRRYADQRGWLVIDTVVDVGASSNDHDRPGLRRLWRRLRRGPKVHILLLCAPDRLTRSLADHWTFVRRLTRRHVRLVSVTVTQRLRRWWQYHAVPQPALTDQEQRV
jgi:DNA invertase Pin-like site-specific DNA recombinase